MRFENVYIINVYIQGLNFISVTFRTYNQNLKNKKQVFFKFQFLIQSFLNFIKTKKTRLTRFNTLYSVTSF